MAIKLGILTTHPIQYQVPWLRRLAKEPDIDLTVFFCMIPDEQQQSDGFGVKFKWDIPLLDGYRYEVLNNIAKMPSVTRFRGCDTPGIGKIVRDGGFDAFIVNGWNVKSCLQLLLTCRRLGVPCIVRGESNAMRPRPWWVRVIHKILLRQYAAFLVIGKSNRDFYLNYGVPEEKIFRAPYGVDNGRLHAQAEVSSPERNRIRSGWGIPEDAVTFLYCAKFIEKKRPLDLIEALSLAIQRTAKKSIHLLMAGDGELRAKCEEIARALNLPITFTGFLNQREIVKAYVASDCLILPSDYGETWGLVVNEAMACGRPAIVSDRVGCYPDLILPGDTGEVFPFGDVKALSDIMVSFVSTPETLRKMGESAEKMVGRYSVSAVVSGCIDAIRYVCPDRSGPAGILFKGDR